MTSDDEFKVRLVKTEADVASLTKSVDSIASSVEELADSVHAGFRDIHNTLGNEISNVYDRVNKSQQTSWPTIFSGIAVIITIIIVVLSAYTQEQNAQNESIKTLQTWQLKEAYDHGRRDEQIKYQDKTIENLKKRLDEFFLTAKVK